MGRDHEARHVFFAVGIGAILVLAILLVFAPTIVANIKYDGMDVWVVKLPPGTHWVYGIGGLLLAMSPLIIAILDVRKLSILLSIVFLLSSVPVFVFGSNAHEYITSDGIFYKKAFAFEQIHYGWDEVDEVIRYMGNDADQYYGYEITFKDGTKYYIDDDTKLTSYRRLLNSTLQSHGVEIQLR
jgi:hypothetical protein